MTPCETDTPEKGELYLYSSYTPIFLFLYGLTSLGLYVPVANYSAIRVNPHVSVPSLWPVVDVFISKDTPVLSKCGDVVPTMYRHGSETPLYHERPSYLLSRLYPCRHKRLRLPALDIRRPEL